MVHVEEIRASMARKGMTQKELASRLGMAEKTLSLKMKNGSFGLEEAKKMIRILDLEDPVYIFCPKSNLQSYHLSTCWA